jgi:multicomponent Na+:H+ antiporter subunit D
MIASLLWIVTTVYAIGYMRGNDEHAQTRFFACFAVAILSAMGIAFAGNLLTLFLFYELMTISTFPLVTHKGTDEAKRSGRVYLGILMGTSIGLQLVAIIGCWILAGSLDFVPGGLLAGHAEGWPVLILFGLFVFGIGKAAVMPFHRWLPAAMVAPTPVSALLHAVAVVKAGVFSVVKVVVYVFGLDLLNGTSGTEWIAVAAGFTILSASLVALRQDNLKRRLAYSTISQLSYIVLAAAILAPLSVMGAALHIMAHAFGKITLFFAAGSIYTAAHKTEIS